MQPTSITSTDAAVFGRLVKPDRGDLSPEAAREILSLRFDEQDARRMNQLAEKARRATALCHPKKRRRSKATDARGIFWAFSGRRLDYP